MPTKYLGTTAAAAPLIPAGVRPRHAAFRLVPVGVGGDQGHAIFHDLGNGLSDGVRIVYAPQRVEYERMMGHDQLCMETAQLRKKLQLLQEQIQAMRD